MFLELKRNFGQGLLEMVIAVALVIAIVVSVLFLVNTNLTGQKESEFQIVAANLAREGIEVVRNIRDSNWLAQINNPNIRWDEGLADAVADDITAIIVLDRDYSDNNFRSLDFSVDNINEVNAQIYRQGGMHLQFIGPKEGMTPTVFYRLLILESLCLNFATGQVEIRPQTNCESGEEKIGLDIKSQVNWLHQDRVRQTILRDRIYDWKY